MTGRKPFRALLSRTFQSAISMRTHAPPTGSSPEAVETEIVSSFPGATLVDDRDEGWETLIEGALGTMSIRRGA
jgi:hypothetical protein